MSKEKMTKILFVLSLILVATAIVIEKKAERQNVHALEYKYEKAKLDKWIQSGGGCPVSSGDGWIEECNGTFYQLNNHYCPSQGGTGRINC